MRPAVAAISPSTTDRNVVLPQPEGPTIERNSPSITSRSTPSSATSRALIRGWKYSRRIPCAASLTVMVSCSGAPDIEPALDVLDDLDQDHAGGDDGEHADENLVGLEAR